MTDVVARNDRRGDLLELEARVHELEQLIVAFAGHHVTDFTVSCPACIAERRLRAIAKELTP